MIGSKADFRADVFPRTMNRRDGSEFVGSAVVHRRLRNWIVDMLTRVLG